MRTWTLASLLVVPVGVASSVCLVPAQASSHSSPPTQPRVSVVELTRKSTSKATVKVDLRCPKGAKYDLSVEILQDSTPDLAPLDAYYTGTKPLKGRCGSSKKRLHVTAVADTSGTFAPSDGRLRRGPAEVVLGGELAGEPAVLTASAEVR